MNDAPNFKSPNSAIKVLCVHSIAEIEAARELFRAYAAWTGLDLEFQNFEAEVASLPGVYAPPRGCLLLAQTNNQTNPQWAGCVALRPLPHSSAHENASHTACELKRLFVPDEFRGRGIGKALVVAAIREARALGYMEMKLDTLESLTAAGALYRSLGFEMVAPYCHNPMPDAQFFGLKLAP